MLTFLFIELLINKYLYKTLKNFAYKVYVSNVSINDF